MYVINNSFGSCAIFLFISFLNAKARLFNSEDTGYDVLVASDAIGMGLNLNIRR